MLYVPIAEKSRGKLTLVGIEKKNPVNNNTQWINVKQKLGLEQYSMC